MEQVNKKGIDCGFIYVRELLTQMLAYAPVLHIEMFTTYCKGVLFNYFEEKDIYPCTLLLPLNKQQLKIVAATKMPDLASFHYLSIHKYEEEGILLLESLIENFIKTSMGKAQLSGIPMAIQKEEFLKATKKSCENNEVLSKARQSAYDAFCMLEKQTSQTYFYDYCIAFINQSKTRVLESELQEQQILENVIPFKKKE